MKHVALKIVAKATSDDEVELELMNEIVHEQWRADWGDGTTAKSFQDALRGKSPKTINLKLNSYGGVASEGIAMYNILRESAAKGAKVKGTVLGIAASASSIVACACDELTMATGSRLMIHKAGIMGYMPFSNSKDLRKTADTLDHLDGELAAIYEARSAGKADKAKFLDLMEAETYLSASEAIDLGLATETDTELKAVACVGSEFLAKGMRSIPTAEGASTEPVAAAETHNKENPVKLEELIAKFPEHAQALRDEGRTQANVDLAAAATAERKRIQDVLAQSMPGHEEIVNAMAFDGKSTAGEVALAIVAAEKKNRATHHTNMRAEAPKPVSAASSSAGNGSAGPNDQNLSVEERAQKAWDNDASLHAEFDEFKDFLAYEKGRANGNVRVKGA